MANNQYGIPIPESPGATVVLDSTGRPWPLRNTINFQGFSVVDDPQSRTSKIISCPVLHSFGDEPLGAGLPGASCYHDLFWPGGEVDIGGFYWDVWIKPSRNLAGSMYVISAGPGGDHPILFGVQPNGTEYWQVTGNFWIGGGMSVGLSQQTCDLLKWDEWANIIFAKVGVDPAAYLFTIINGQLSKVRAWGSSPRLSAALASALYVLGHTHDEYRGSVASIVGFDTNNPPVSLAPSSCFARRPERRMYNSLNGIYADFAGDYMTPGGMVPDRSTGQAPVKSGVNSRIQQRHDGQLAFTYNQSNTYKWQYPDFRSDADCPLYATEDRMVANAYVKPRGAMPTDKQYLVYDDFSLQRKIFPDIIGGLPTVEPSWGGSLGPQAYATLPPVLNGTNYSYGVFAGNLCFCGGTGSSYFAPLLVNCRRSNIGIQISSPSGADQISNPLIGGPGFWLRLAGTLTTPDLNDGSYAVWYNNTVIIHDVVAGVDTARTPVAVSANTTMIRVEANGTTWRLFQLIGTVSTQVATWTNSDVSTGTLCGPVMADSGARISEWGCYPL